MLERIARWGLPWLDPNDTPGPNDAPPVDAEAVETPEGDETVAEVAPEVDDIPRLSRDEWERSERERADAERIAAVERELAEAKRSRDAAAQAAAAQTGGSVEDPFADVTAEDLRSDPELRRQKAMWDATQQAIREAQETRKELLSIKENARKSAEQRERAAANRTAYDESMDLATRMMKRSTAYNGATATHEIRQRKYLASVDATVQQKIREGWDGQRIGRFLASHLPDFIAEAEAEYGVPASGVTAPAIPAKRDRTDVLAHDAAARNNINAGGAAPPTGRVDDGKRGNPPTTADMIRLMQRDRQTISSSTL